MKPAVLLANTIGAASMAIPEPRTEVRLASAVDRNTRRIRAGGKTVNFLNPEVWPAALKRRAALEAPSAAGQ